MTNAIITIYAESAHLIDVPLCYRGHNFCDFLFTFLYTDPHLKKGVKVILLESVSFPFNKIP